MLELMKWDCSQVLALGLDGALAEQFYYKTGEFKLPGQYASPHGFLLIAMDGGNACGWRR